MTNNNETKPQIKLNRKMRMWNKYRLLCITAVVIVAVIIVMTAAVRGISGKKGKTDTAANTTTSANVVTTEAAQQTADTQASEQTTAASEPAEQTTTKAAGNGTLTVSGTATAEQFTSQNFFDDTVFLGDSVISGISSYGYLDNVYGNVNATSAKLESYVTAAMANKPSKVFVMVGHNDANYGTIKEATVGENIISIVEAIHKISSTTKVYILSVTPITSAYERKTSINVEQSYLDNVNAIIEENAAANNYTYIDVASAYKDDTGYMKTECTGNGINLTNSYYPFLLNGIASVAK